MKKKLENPYELLIKEREVKANLLKEKIDSSLEDIRRHTQTATQLGHDGRVDEAIMLTFLHSLLESTINSYKAVNSLVRQKQKNDIEKEIEKITEAKDLEYSAEKDVEQLNKYQVLYTKKSALEKELETDSLDDIQRKAKEAELGTIKSELLDIEDYFGMTSEELEKNTQKSQTRFFGEKDAEAMKNMRHQTGNSPEKLAKAGIDTKNIDQMLFDIMQKASIENMSKKLTENAKEFETEQQSQTEKMA